MDRDVREDLVGAEGGVQQWLKYIVSILFLKKSEMFYLKMK